MEPIGQTEPESICVVAGEKRPAGPSTTLEQQILILEEEIIEARARIASATNERDKKELRLDKLNRLRQDLRNAGFEHLIYTPTEIK